MEPTNQSLDQSQRAHEPTAPLGAAELLARLTKEAEPKENDSEEAIWNRQRAAAETAMIFELKDSRAFNWFFEEFVVKPYAEAFEALRDVHTEDLTKARTEYLALKKARIGLIEREIIHRQQLDVDDPEIARLREKLSVL